MRGVYSLTQAIAIKVPIIGSVNFLSTDISNSLEKGIN